MAWSPQARAAAIAARKRKARGRAKPQYGVSRGGKGRMSNKQIAAKSKGKRPAARPTKGSYQGRVKSKRNARIDKKIKKLNKRAVKRTTKQATKLTRNMYTDGKGNVYTNRKGVKAYNKGVKIGQKAQRKTAKLKAKKRK